MKRFIVFLVFITICGTSMAGFTSDIEEWYDDLLEFFDLYRDRDEILEKVDAYDQMIEESNPPASESYVASINTDSEILNDLPLTDSTGISATAGTRIVRDNSDSTVISNPEPCAIILSSIGLGMVGYLKRRRAI